LFSRKRKKNQGGGGCCFAYLWGSSNGDEVAQTSRFGGGQSKFIMIVQQKAQWE
jgi:hypothetical protein